MNACKYDIARERLVLIMGKLLLPLKVTSCIAMLISVFAVHAETIQGTPWSDYLMGTSSADTIIGLGGNDIMLGLGGDDQFLFDGIDPYYALDTVSGGPGFDTIVGGDNDDEIGLSQFIGDNRVERIDGGAGTNLIVGSWGTEVYDFSATQLLNIDRIDGRGGDDFITGSTADDTIVGGIGSDTLSGIEGDDIFLFEEPDYGVELVSGGPGFDRFVCGDGDDEIFFKEFSGENRVERIEGGAGVNVIVGKWGVQNYDFSETELVNIARIEGRDSDDTIIGSPGDDTISGGAGIDVLRGMGGDDRFLFDGVVYGLDQISGGPGFDTIIGGDNDDHIGLSVFTGNDRVERIDGGAGSNTIIGDWFGQIFDFSETELVNISLIDGQGGDDQITGSAGNDVISGGTGYDHLWGMAGDDQFQFIGLDYGLDTVSGGSGFDTIIGGEGNDQISLSEFIGDNRVERIDGGAGVNLIVGNWLAQQFDFSETELLNIARIEGQGGDDDITGSPGDDVIEGGTGNDTLNGYAGNDLLVGGIGNDIYVVDAPAPALVVIDNSTSSGSVDHIEWNVSSASVHISKIISGPQNTALQLVSGTTRIVVLGHFLIDDNAIDFIRFADNSEWDKAYIADQAVDFFDRDGDYIPDAEDAFPDDPTEWSDLDGDGIGDNSDPDRDGDGVVNDQDVFPDNPAEWSDLDGDGIGDNADPDRDGDGIVNDDDAFPNDSTEWSDLDGDGIGDNTDTDRDGDGVENDQDTYPDDTTRSQLAAVTNLTVAQQGTVFQISWDVHPETALLQGYRLLRADFGSDSWSEINGSTLLTQTTFTDDTVQNQQAYQYRVIAIDSANRDGEPTAAVNQFLLFNQTVISTGQAEWVDYQASLSWTHSPAANESYRLYKINTGVGTQLYDGQDAFYTDSGSHWNAAQNYQLVSILTATNPITDSAQQAEGPPSDIHLVPLPAITAQVLEAEETSALHYQVEVHSGTQLSISGTYANAIRPLTITLTSTDGSTTSTKDDGKFQFVVRDVMPQQINIELNETGAPADRSIVLTLDVIEDQTPMMIDFDSNLPTMTSNSMVSISGQVQNATQGIATIKAINNRYPDQTIGLTVLADNRFSGEIPLKTGDNQVSVSATSNMGESAQATLTVERQANAIPTIEFVSHQNNQVVTTHQIDLAGRLYSSLGIDQLQLSINGMPTSISSVMEQVYQFSLSGIALERGYNRLVAQATTPLGNVESSIVIYYQDTTVDPLTPQALKIIAPFENQGFNAELLIVKGQLFNAGADAEVTVNGESTQLFGSAAAGYLFSHPLDISGMAEGSFTINVTASSSGKDAIAQTITVNIDNQPPQLTIDNDLAAPSTVNEIHEQPYRISGSVIEANLASLSINGQGLSSQPIGNNTYVFDTQVNFAAGEQTTLVISASDTAGNSTQQQYEILSNPQLDIEIIQPLDQAEFQTSGTSYDLPYIVRLSGITGGENLIISAGSASQTLPVTQAVNEGSLTINTAETIESMNFEVRNANDEVLASSEIALNLVNLDNQPLALIKTNPARNEKDYEPHFPIQFFFNKPVNLADLSVTVRQTYHGNTYANTAPSGAGFSEKYQGEIVEVHYDQQPVPGGLSLLPGERIVEFYPDEDIAFGASVYVDISHQGNELERFIYHVRKSPTFANVIVRDQDNNIVSDMPVSIPALGISGKTDTNGSFIFNGEGTETNSIQSGLYRLVINPGQANPHYGVSEIQIRLENGRMNKLGSRPVPALNPDVPYRNLRSGVADNVLVGGDLVIDTRNAHLSFGDGSDQGNVHIQVLEYGSGIYRPIAVPLAPLWAYNLQPGPIEVRGTLSIKIRMPMLYGSYDYLPDNGTPVLLMGYDDESLKLTPIGVGRVNNGIVTSEGEVQATRLDYLGYTLLSAAQYPILQDYLDGQIGLDQLTALLLQD